MIQRGLSGGIREAISSRMEESEDPIEEKPVDNNIRTEWNKYVDWLGKKGMKGSAELDKDDLGGKMIDAYKKENPSTVISREIIPTIQKEFSKYRDWSLNEIKENRGAFAKGTTKDNFMSNLSKVDGYAGSKTTSFSFPQSYISKFEDGRNMGTINQGFTQTKQK